MPASGSTIARNNQKLVSLQIRGPFLFQIQPYHGCHLHQQINDGLIFRLQAAKVVNQVECSPNLIFHSSSITYLSAYLLPWRRWCTSRLGVVLVWFLRDFAGGGNVTTYVHLRSAGHKHFYPTSKHPYLTLLYAMSGEWCQKGQEGAAMALLGLQWLLYIT